MFYSKFETVLSSARFSDISRQIFAINPLTLEAISRQNLVKNIHQKPKKYEDTGTHI